MYKNYSPVSLLPDCGKMFEWLLDNRMFPFFFFSENELIPPKPSEFKPNDSCSKQLTSIHSAFDDGYNVSGVFLDISEVFHRVWHEGLLFKLQ